MADGGGAAAGALPPPYRPASAFQRLRFDHADGVIDLERAIGITVHATESYHLERIRQGRVQVLRPQVGKVFVDVPGSATRIIAHGQVGVFQFRLPLERLAAIASRDHELDVDVAHLADTEGAVRPRLLALAVASASHDCEPDLVETELVGMLIERSGKVMQTRTGGLTMARLRRVYDLVAADPAGLSIERLASAAALSPYHFSREFRRVTGETPWNYVLRRRISRAMDQLLRTGQPIAEIATGNGFRDGSHLARHMRRIFGVTPARWRLMAEATFGTGLPENDLAGIPRAPATNIIL